MREVLVAIDESEASERVADFVNRFFAGLDVAVTALHVGTSPLPWGPYPAAPGLLYPWPPYGATAASGPYAGVVAGDESVEEAAERTVERSSLRSGEQVVELGGDVVETIRRVAEERGVDLVVVGSSHKGLLERFLTSSVSAELAKSAPTPVLVVH